MSSQDFETKIENTINLIRLARHCVVLTGAGISTPSNIPDFRSAGRGLWEENDPIHVASISTFRRDPTIFYNWLRPLMSSIMEAKPNAAHLALAELQRHGLIKAIITQNIDGLHETAGSMNVVNVHGSLLKFDCLNCNTSISSEVETIHFFIKTGQPPKCSLCGAILKPAITLYEEMLPARAWEQAYLQCSSADLIITVGTSLEVYPVYMLPEIALENQAELIINTLSTTSLDARAIITLPYDVVDVWIRIQSALIEKSD